MKICLVGATHVSYNPRLVREADSLVAAGHEVRVVAPSLHEGHSEQDERLVRRRKWRFQPFSYRRRRSWFPLSYWWIRGRPRLQRLLFKLWRHPELAARAYLAGSSELERLVVAEKADWFIAHAQGVLPIAARAAHRWQARLGFDMEDILTLSPEEPTGLLQAIERKYIPMADYVSVPSEAIRRRVLEQYPACKAVTLYNVFPRSLASSLKSPAERRRPSSQRVRLHWFGQTIGRGRGLRFAIEAVAPLRDRVELHVRGVDWSPSFHEIRSCAQKWGVPFFHHPLIDYDDLIASLGEYDIGLALEQAGLPHYVLTVTNKFFSYLLAGLAIAATDTPGQREMLSQMPDAGFLFPAGEPAQLSAGLSEWINDPDRLLAAQTASWKSGRERFCWDIEQRKFLLLLDGAGSTGPPQVGSGAGD